MIRVIPTYENNTWTVTKFDTDQEFIDFILSIFKVPGEYAFDETSWAFNEQSKNFESQGFYCAAPFRSKDFNYYWDDQKEKCRKGVIFKNNGNFWYLTRDYYMWLNFLPIYDKAVERIGI